MDETQIINVCGELSFLLGRRIHAYISEYSFIGLRLDSDEIVCFSTEEVSVGKWFEVFPIKRDELPKGEFTWHEMNEPFAISDTRQLWRDEWMEFAEDNGQFMGSGPHSTIFSSPVDRTPEEVEHPIRVLAGIKLINNRKRHIVICSSDGSPFQMNLAMNEEESESILRAHTCE